MDFLSGGRTLKFQSDSGRVFPVDFILVCGVVFLEAKYNSTLQGNPLGGCKAMAGNSIPAGCRVHPALSIRGIGWMDGWEGGGGLPVAAGGESGEKADGWRSFWDGASARNGSHGSNPST